MAASKKDKTTKKKVKKNIPVGIAHIKATFNNIIVAITDLRGNLIAWNSAGAQFRGPKKSTPHAAQIVTEYVAQKAIECGVKTITVRVKGPGGGRESSLRTLAASGLVIASVKDVTPIAHNGVRAKKPRSV